jgi:hypothetical protein
MTDLSLPAHTVMNDLYYNWELVDAEEEWVAGGSCNTQEEAEAAGTRYLIQYTQDGAHKLTVTEFRSRVVNEILAADVKLENQ